MQTKVYYLLAQSIPTSESRPEYSNFSCEWGSVMDEAILSSLCCKLKFFAENETLSNIFLSQCILLYYVVYSLLFG